MLWRRLVEHLAGLVELRPVPVNSMHVLPIIAVLPLHDTVQDLFNDLVLNVIISVPLHKYKIKN